jgi:hypothetical protein
MDKCEYLSGLPEVGIVPRAPHAGPLLREQFTTDPRFAYRATRLAEVRAAADMSAAARDDLWPTVGDDEGGS